MSGSHPEELWAFVDDGGLVCAAMPGLGVVPLVTNKRTITGMMSPLAQLHAKRSGKPVSLVRYALREVCATIEPDDA